MTNMQKLLLIWTRAGEGEDDSPESSDDAIDWSMFGESSLEDDIVEDEDELEEVVEDVDAASDDTTQEEVKTAVEDTAVEDVAPKVEPVVEASVEADPVVAPTAEQEKQIAEQRTKFLSELEGGYQISKDDADMLLTEPEKVLPRLMANATMQILEQAAQMIQSQLQSLPEIIKQTQSVQAKETEVMGLVQKQYPALLESDEGKKALIDAAKLIRDKYPTESVEKRLERSGKLAYAILGLELVQTEPKVNAVAKVAPKPRPHVPAKTGTSPEVNKLNEQEAFFASIEY